MRLVRIIRTVLICLGTGFFLYYPVHAGTPAKHLDAGDRFSLFIDSTGKLFSWGSNAFKNKKTQRPVSIAADVIAMSAAKGETAIFYVTRDHTLWGYGSSQFGQIGMENGHASSPIPLMHNIVFIDAGHDTPFAIDEKGQLWTWGDENPAKGKPIKPEPSVSVFPTRLVNIADNIEQVSSSFSHTLALARDGTLLAWGDNQSGSLGDGTNIDRAHPVKVDTSALGKRKIIKIATRMGESFAVTDDGSLWNWGQSYTFPAEPGAHFPRLKPEKVPYFDNVADIAPGWGHLLVLKKDKTVWIAGTGKLLNKDNFNEKTHRWFSPRQIASNVAEIASGPNHILLRKTDGTIMASGENFSDELGIPFDRKQDTSTLVTVPVPR